MLAFEPPHFGPQATFGGCIAAGIAGPRRAAAGAVRDFVLGAVIMNGQGQMLHFGGQVMKNVAGYDVSRLMAGSLGTLGLILEVSVKVLPLPQAEATLRFDMNGTDAVRKLNEWGGQPLPISASAGVTARWRCASRAPKPRSRRRARRSAAKWSMRSRRERFWAGLREQTDSFFAAIPPKAALWRLALPSITEPLQLPGAQLIEWGGGAALVDHRHRRANRAHQREAGRRSCDDLPHRPRLRPQRRRVHAAARAADENPSRPEKRFRPGPHLQSRPSLPRLLSDAMQTNLADFIRNTPDGDEADAILRNCVHCGFCTATCPTYQLLGDELDGPRGRIYLIKQMVEGAPVTRSTQLHLDRCLTCRNCETTCPSGVQYGRLVEIGRKLTEEKVTRPLRSAAARAGCSRASCRTARCSRRPCASASTSAASCRRNCATRCPRGSVRWNGRRAKHARKMLMLAGCVQPSMMPNVNIATARVLDALGVETVIAPDAGCCGAIRLHLGYNDEALDDMRANIDAWWPYVEAGRRGDRDERVRLRRDGQGIRAPVAPRSGVCGQGAAHRRIDARRRGDPAGVRRSTDPVTRRRSVHTVAFHPPCTLQHGQQVRGKVEHLLTALGVEVRLPADSHLCCGSAGTYSLTQPKLSYALRDQKLERLHAQEPQLIVSANVGCIAHLQSGTSTPVAHWIELVEHMLSV